MVFKRQTSISTSHWRQWCRVHVVVAFLFTGLWQSAEAGVYYRYENDKGVKVLGSSIPPEYVSQGYEVVNEVGQVIRVVEPAMTPEQLQKRAEAQELAKWDADLRRKYSSVLDIEAAKERKLAELQINISILKGNIVNLRSQMDKHQGSAASYERSGRAVPENIVAIIGDLQAEIDDTQMLIDQREREKSELAEEYDTQIERFRVIGKK